MTGCTFEDILEELDVMCINEAQDRLFKNVLLLKFQLQLLCYDHITEMNIFNIFQHYECFEHTTEIITTQLKFFIKRKVKTPFS